MNDLSVHTNPDVEQKKAPAVSGMLVLLLNTLLILTCTALFCLSVFRENIPLIVLTSVIGFVICPLLYCGLKVLKPKEALVLTLFGKYHGTLIGEGFFYVNPFAVAFNPSSQDTSSGSLTADSVLTSLTKTSDTAQTTVRRSKKISLKAMTLNNDKQKINDLLGNPIIIGIVVIWRVVNTAKAVFNVDNYTEFLSIQCDSALRNIVRLYPYDAVGDESNYEHSLRGSSQEIAEKLQAEIQSKVEIAGIEVVEARITHLAYAPEIAAAMLQRQQASAIIDARQMIVDGAVGMVEMALAKLSDSKIVELDEERKAAMVSNLLVVLCGNKDTQPVINSGTLY